MQYDLTQPGLYACLQLFFTQGLGSLTFGRLMEAFGSAERALQKEATDWGRIGVAEKIYRKAQKPPSKSVLKAIEKWLHQSQKHHLVSYDCPHYPASLRTLVDPPAVLYVLGNMEVFKFPTIAIIGSRQATPVGLKTTQKFAYELASQGLSICSGLALGVDACAHLGALSAGGSTVAFMGTGVDVIYPKANEKIATQMVQENGLLVSELPLGTKPLGRHFPPRNRLICGLSTHGVVVVESKSKGGSMITARLANEQGREVFALPGSIQSPLSEGCHLLIQQGAKLVQNTQDILDELRLPVSENKASQKNEANSSPEKQNSIPPMHKQILTAMNYEIVRTEELVTLTSLALGVLTTALLELELQGKIQSLSGNRWQRIV